MCLGIQQRDLNINLFYLRLYTRKPVPESLTLCYLPRINGSPLQINGSWIRPDAPGFVTLHRVVSGSGLFGSRERVRVSEGTRFEVYIGEDKVIKGIFGKDEANEWRMELKCGLEREIGVSEAEVRVGANGEAEMSEKVKVAKGNNTNAKRRKYCFQKLEEIPEQREGDEVTESDDCSCCCHETNIECDDEGDEVDLEGVSWAVNVGIWVVCLGVGYLVTKASSKHLRRKIIRSKKFV